jgi:glyoxylase-like metal-dependent hydrolase (beta-lactamase superfamily II)
VEIYPGLTAIDFDGRVWAYLYEEAGSLALIDTGISGRVQLVLDAIAAARRKPEDLRSVVLTHCHKDHAGTLAELQRMTGARALVHSLDAPVVRGEAEAGAPVLSAPEQAIFNVVAADIPDSEPAAVHHELEDGDEIDIGGGARIIHLPGHTPGSIAVYLPLTRTLFTGDAVASIDGRLIPGVFNVDPVQARESLQRLAAIDFDIACFGHGPPLARDASVAFRRLVERL